MAGSGSEMGEELGEVIVGLKVRARTACMWNHARKADGLLVGERSGLPAGASERIAACSGVIPVGAGTESELRRVVSSRRWTPTRKP